jgi:hypothetical protein
MAPRKKPGPKPEKQEAVKSSEVTGMITKSALAGILTLDKRTKTAQSELAGELGSAIAKAVERFGTNRKALGIIRQLNRMEPEKLADFLDHFDYMLDVSGLEKRAESVQRLPLAEEKADPEEEAEKPVEPDAKVSRPQFGAKAASEVA